MIVIRSEIPRVIFNEQDKDKIELINLIVEVCKRNKIGRLLAEQRIEYNLEDLSLIKRIYKFANWIHENECRNFRTKAETIRLIEVLIEFSRQNKPIMFYALFCPAYKKGINVYGFKREIGETSKRGIENLSSLASIARSLGFMSEAICIFSDLALENCNKLKESDFKDLEENFNNLKAYANKKDKSLVVLKLSEINNAKGIGIVGITSGSVKLPNNEVFRIFRRSIPFYKDVLGWKDEEIFKRTQDLARSCLAMKNEIEKTNSLSMMVMTENNYERGVFYNADKLNITPIFYPRKKESQEEVI
jgi:hypothetical protein